MNTPARFQELTKEQQVDFFIKCQELLVKYHPNSQFLFTKENLEERRHWVEGFLKKYKGYVYADDNICVLFNKVRVDDARNPQKTLKDYFYSEPAENFNAVSIDFVVFRKLGDCMEFCKSQYSPQIEWIVFVKNNELKLYKTKDLLVHLNAPAHVLSLF
jgi:hypothetical protein